MKWQELNISTVRRAIQLYLEVAYDDSGSKRLLKPYEVADTVEQLLEDFFLDEKREELGRSMCRYSLRLGNKSYPHMKLVLHEYLVRGEFFFSVDTHDQIEVKPSYPDYDAWIKLKQFNADLKESIENRWREEGIPTLRELRCVVREEEARVEHERADVLGERTVLVVDDEKEIIDAIEELLSSRGFHVERAANGQEAIEIAQRIHPDLILMDYQMPLVNGIEACATLKDGQDTRDIPVLLATACSERIEKIGRADGFLVKPYESETLIHFVRHHMNGQRAS